MKRFRFSLETVKVYKEQLLENLKTEYSAALALVRAKEEEIARLEGDKARFQQEWNEKAAAGLSIREHQQYQQYLDRLHRQIRLEKHKLEELVRKAEAKREEVVEMNKETTTLEKLKEKKKAEYDKAEAKEHDLFIEEFVSKSLFELKK